MKTSKLDGWSYKIVKIIRAKAVIVAEGWSAGNKREAVSEASAELAKLNPKPFDNYQVYYTKD